MVLPLIPLVLIGTGAGTGIVGAVVGAAGLVKFRRASTIHERARVQYEACLARTGHKARQTNGRIRRYGRQQGHARRHVVIRMADFMRRHQRQVTQSAAQLLSGLDVEIPELPEFAGVLTADVRWLSGAATAAATGAATAVGVPALVGAVGTASTGAAISGLSGAAASSATAAWLGGGSLAAGGGGVALGATALNFVTIGPTLLVTGLVLNGQGEKTMTRARGYEAEMRIAVEQQGAFCNRLDDVQARVSELSTVLRELIGRAQASIRELEQVQFDPIQHADMFRQTMRLVLAVRDFGTVPILDEDGELNGATDKLIIKYRECE
ncbi:MAG: hypothetical protein LH471_05225 [Salinibacterium sp.]|nr:hypothetical protein [Salinibacterium sp.]